MICVFGILGFKRFWSFLGQLINSPSNDHFWMQNLDRWASNVLNSSQNARNITIFRQHAAIHWQFGSFWTGLGSWLFCYQILRRENRFVRAKFDPNGSRLRRPETQGVDRWSAFSASLGFQGFWSFLGQLINSPSNDHFWMKNLDR